MPSNCTIISWKGKKEMVSLLLSAIGYRLSAVSGALGCIPEG